MSAEERREAHLRAMEPGVGPKGRHLNDTDAARRYDDLLAYFDETEPAVAAAIRYGVTATQAVGRNYLDDAPLPIFLQVNYPDETKP